MLKKTNLCLIGYWLNQQLDDKAFFMWIEFLPHAITYKIRYCFINSNSILLYDIFNCYHFTQIVYNFI